MGHFQIRHFEVHSRWAGGGTVRCQRKGRRYRPLSSRHPLHLVLKLHPQRRISLRQRKHWSLIYTLMKRYGRRFKVSTQQCSIQNNHIHILVSANRRSDFQSFFRVFAGQIAQQILGKNLNSGPFWQHRLWTCVVRTQSYLVTVKNYIRLNEQEARGRIKYSKLRLRGLSSADWEILWKW